MAGHDEGGVLVLYCHGFGGCYGWHSSSRDGNVVVELLEACGGVLRYNDATQGYYSIVCVGAHLVL